LYRCKLKILECNETINDLERGWRRKLKDEIPPWNSQERLDILKTIYQDMQYILQKENDTKISIVKKSL
jgi:hypothetical protein